MFSIIVIMQKTKISLVTFTLIIFCKFTLILTNVYSNNCTSAIKCVEDCIPFHQCYEAEQLIKNDKYNPKVIQLFQESTCGDSIRKDFILCNKIRLKYKNIIDNLPPSDKCGIQPLTSKIFNGERAELDDFPWTVLIKYKNSSDHFSYRCHGSLISNRYVVTAAHCLDLSRSGRKKEQIYSVILGEYDTNTSRDCINDECADPTQELFIETFFVYPQSEKLHSDIGLIRLNGTASFSDFVQPICLPFNFSGLEHHEPLWITGWGKTENRTLSSVKLKGHILALSKEDCFERIHYIPDSSELCAGSDNGTDTCKGDSGAPLMAERITDGDSKVFLVGIVSFGLQCGTNAAIYTNVIKFTDWIVNKMEN